MQTLRQKQEQRQEQRQAREREQEQELPFCRKRPKQQQPSQRSEREIYSFVLPDKKTTSGNCIVVTHKTKPTHLSVVTA